MLDIRLCTDCGDVDCTLYICIDHEGFIVICCIVSAIIHNYSILGKVDSINL